MGDYDISIKAKLQWLADQQHGRTIAEIAHDAIALIERLTAEHKELAAENARLTAEVERLKPKPMTDQEVAGVLSRNRYRDVDDWRPWYGDFNSPKLCHSTGRLTGIAVAEKLERDAGPIAGPLEQEVVKP